MSDVDPLVLRAVTVILKCKTLEQLSVAISYSDLVLKEITKTVERVDESKFFMYVERAIGFAQCNILSEMKKNVE